MAITDPMVLPEDALLVPVAELSADVRRRLDGLAGDYALTRPHLRTASRLLDAAAAELLSLFRSPRTIAEAVVRYSRERGADPEAILEEAFPLLQSLVDAGFLAPAGAPPARPTLDPGSEVAGWQIRSCLQSLEDTELYLAGGAGGTGGTGGNGGWAAVKVERAPGTATAELAWEGEVLRELSGDGAPRLLGMGEILGRRYLATEWRAGVDAATAAAELRRLPGEEGRRALRDLGGAVADAYARLHGRGVLHGDIHPRNVLVAADGAVSLLDFGRSHRRGGIPGLVPPGRAGVGFFYEPELAAAYLSGEPPPAPSAAGEQYGLAVLLYLLFAGAYPVDFALEKGRMLRQVVEEPPLPFAERGAAPWPAVEAVLARALAKAPGERFPAVAELAAALRGSDPGGEEAATRAASTAGASRAEALLDRVLARTAADGPLAVALPPKASLNYGGAGIAYALYRIALAREEPALLSAADLWAARAVRLADDESEEGFYAPEIRIERKVVGEVSPYHSPTGPLAVQALIAHALGDPAAQRRAVAGFLAAARKPCANPDLTLGRSGVLLATALLLDALAATDVGDIGVGGVGGVGDPGGAPLRALGEEGLAGLWEELDALPPIPDCAALPNLGIAHGWAGFLYATLRWCRLAGSPPPARLPERLAELAGCAEPWGRGLRWRWYDVGPRWSAGSMPGWCNGSAGLVHLWTLAHATCGEPRFGDLALGAAWNAWESPDPQGDLCCGLAGRAYALLNLHRQGGGAVWLARARTLAERAAADLSWAVERPDSLYKGEVGLALLAAELVRPAAAAMPFFESEGWSK